MKLILYTIALFILFDINSGKSQGIKFDCRLYAEDFDEHEYFDHAITASHYKDFVSDKEDGVFFINRFFGRETFYKAIMLKKQNNNFVIVNLLKSGEVISLPAKDKSIISETFAQIEKGVFRQACSVDSSEGSLSVLIVKVSGEIVLKYEANFADYTHLNKSEEFKVKKGLELVKILTDAVD